MTKRSRQERAKEAAVRQEEYLGLSTAQKIARCATRPGESKKELAKLRIDHAND